MSDDIVQRTVINTPDGVALVGDDGSVFVLTSEDLERHRLTDEGATELGRRLADDEEVSGFGLQGLDVGGISLSGPLGSGKSPGLPTPPASGTLLAGIDDDEYRRR